MRAKLEWQEQPESPAEPSSAGAPPAHLRQAVTTGTTRTIDAQDIPYYDIQLSSNNNFVSEMSTPSPRRLRIRRFSRIMAVIAVFLTAAAPALVFLMALLTPIESLADSVGIDLSTQAFTAAEKGRLMFGVVMLVSALPLSFGLIRLGACFRGFAEGALFEVPTIAGLRDFAGAMLFWALAQPFFQMIAGLALTIGAPEGNRQLALQLRSDTILMAAFALCVLIVSWVLTEASALSEENAQFI